MLKSRTSCLPKAKNLFYFTLLVIFSISILAITSSFAQIPNASFESWTSGNPDGWQTTNNAPQLVNVTQITDAHNGSSALKGTVTSIAGFGIPVAIISGTNDKGFPNTTRAEALHGWFKFTSVSADKFYVDVVFKKNGNSIGAATYSTTTSVNNYTEFIANSVWDSSDSPDSAYIAFQVSATTGTSVHDGTFFILDDLSWGAAGTSGVNDQSGINSGITLGQNEPNPCTGLTSIHYTVPVSSEVTLKIYDILGQEVATIVNGEVPAGAYDAVYDTSNLRTGVYIYSLQTGTAQITKQFIKVE